MSVKKEYQAGDVTVVWKPELCIHSANCVKGLPEVFKPDDKPWIQVENASSERLMATIDACPSGALSYLKSNSMESKTPVKIISGGPMIVENTVSITLPDGTIEIRENKCSFCRCGASANKPFCDGAHRKIDFE